MHNSEIWLKTKPYSLRYSINMMTNKIHEKSAIHLASTNVPIFRPSQLVKDIKKNLFQHGSSYETINYIYITSGDNQLRGVISVQELINAQDDVQVQKVMETNIVSVHPYSHREKIVHLALKNNLKAIPVVDKQNILLGVIPSDTILSVANNELTEELLLLEGINSKEFASISTVRNSPLKLLLKRLPWLIVGLFGGLLAAQIISYFETLIGEDVLFLSFIPLMVYMSDAVGSQSQTIYIRYIAINNEVNFFTYLFKEVRLGLLLALSLSILLYVLTSLFYSSVVGLSLSISLFITIIFSVIIAIVIPWFLIKLRKDPALGSGPFATILRDLASIVIFFLVTQLFS